MAYYIHIENNQIAGGGESPRGTTEYTHSIEVTKELYERCENSRDDIAFIDNEIVDISETSKRTIEKRLAEIEQELIEVEENFKTYMDTPLLCPLNQKAYKPKWADDGTYLKVIQSFDLLAAMGIQNPTMTIWDATELEENVVEMNKLDIVQLTTWLYQQAQPVYNQKKLVVADLKKEKAELLSENTSDNVEPTETEEV